MSSEGDIACSAIAACASFLSDLAPYDISLEAGKTSELDIFDVSGFSDVSTNFVQGHVIEMWREGIWVE